MTTLPDDLITLLRGHALAFLATLMPDGSPQLTEVWADTDGEHVVINTVQSHQKARNIRRDPRVAVNIADPDQPSRYWAVRGTVVEMTTEGGAEHIEALSQRYTGRPYPWWGGRDQIRVILTIKAESVRG
ncbi:MAG TPA: PPOX class F420-dependent oxidoreductase [Micromonosporaceae bacterium]|jgi:PPOX class probable F420-dependent enzyme